MPVHAHDGAEGLEPEGVRQPAQEFVAAVVMHDGLADDGAERRHALAQPRRHAAAMEGKISAACSSCHVRLRVIRRFECSKEMGASGHRRSHQHAEAAATFPA